MANNFRNQKDYSPVPWTSYFDEAHDIEVENHGDILPSQTGVTDGPDSFRVYLRNFKEPYSPPRVLGHQLNPSSLDLSRAELAEFTKVPTLVAIHGGGYSALTWAEFSRHIEQQCQCRILALDMRGHGDTRTEDPGRMDINTLVRDLANVIHATHRLCGFQETPKIVLVGHSMGGAVAIKCAAKSLDLLPSLAGIVIIDVVEGTAKDALPLMMSVIRARPTKFTSLSGAIEWAIKSGMAKNSDAARVSMPGNLLNLSNGTLGIHDVPVKCKEEDSEESKRIRQQLDRLKRHTFHISLEQLASSRSSNSPPLNMKPPPCMPPRVAALKRGEAPNLLPSPIRVTQKIEEEDESLDEPDELKSKNEEYKKPLKLDSSGFAWRTNLTKTQPYWQGWFDGLSKDLLDAPVQGKFLLLAGIDRLDKTLTIGQMQGKFMMKVLPKCGHAVHEDVPEQVASCIAEFLLRNKFASPTSS